MTDLAVIILVTNFDSSYAVGFSLLYFFSAMYLNL